MFKFDFGLGVSPECAFDDGLADQESTIPPNSSTFPDPSNKSSSPFRSCSEISVNELLGDIPPFISYSSLKLSPDQSVWKRDLYDARYQTYLEDQSDRGPDTKQGIDLIQGPSDLLPGVYEGGLKTWECSLQLGTALDGAYEKITHHFRTPSSKALRIMELGCGTAVPTLALFSRVCLFLQNLNHERRQTKFNNPTESAPLEFFLQDFNLDVLKLLTFPNLLLAYIRASSLNTILSKHSNNPVFLEPLAETADVEITQELKAEFSLFLEQHDINFHFIYGPWANFTIKNCDFIYSSEALYNPNSIPDFVQVLCRSPEAEIIVASKKLYFGLGGGSTAFIKEVEKRNGTIEFINSALEVEGVGTDMMQVMIHQTRKPV